MSGTFKRYRWIGGLWGGFTGSTDTSEETALSEMCNGKGENKSEWGGKSFPCVYSLNVGVMTCVSKAIV